MTGVVSYRFQISVSRARLVFFCAARARRRRMGQRAMYLRAVIWVLDGLHRKPYKILTCFLASAEIGAGQHMCQESTKMAAPTHHDLAPSQITPNKLATYQKWLQTIEKPLQTLQVPRGASFWPLAFWQARRPCRPRCTTSSTPPSTISRQARDGQQAPALQAGQHPRAASADGPQPLPGKLPTASRAEPAPSVPTEQDAREAAQGARRVPVSHSQLDSAPAAPAGEQCAVTRQCAGDGERSRRRVHHPHGLP